MKNQMLHFAFPSLLAAALGFANLTATAADSQLFRVRADAPTFITRVLPNGQITWTSAVPNINYTLMALPGGQSSWGVVVSGYQSGSTTQSVTVANPAGPANVVAVRAWFHTNALPSVTVNLLDSQFQTRAKNVSDTNGRCWFYDAPADSYTVSYPASTEYAPYYYDCPVTANVGQSNFVNVYFAKKPAQIQPPYDATITSAPVFSWIGVREAAYYTFMLYRDDGSQLTQVDLASGLFQTNYWTVTNLVSGKTYYWNVFGHDIWANPVLYGWERFYSGFSGPGGGTNHFGCDQRVFGVLQCGRYPIANTTVFMTNTTTHVAYVTATDTRGWFDIENIPAGTYNLIQTDTTYMMQGLAVVTMPNYAGHQGVYYLIARAGNLQPAAHSTVATHTPTFSWTGNAAAASYTVNVANWNTGVTMFNQTRSSSPVTSPVALANGDYSWNVTGFDTDGNEVVYGWGGKFTVSAP